MQFLYPGVLYGLAAISIPVIIHLINFRRYRKVYFTRTNLIVDLREQSRRQSTLRHWLILLLRMLTIAALVLAFANPFIKTADTTASRENEFVSIYLDNSFSMQADRGDGDLLNEARNRALAIADAYNPSARFQLLTNEFKAKQQRWLTREQFQSEVEETDFSPQFRKLSEVLNRQHQMFYRDQLSTGDVFQISDFQQVSDDIKAEQLDSSFTYRYVPVRAAGFENTYIDSVWFTSPVLFVNQRAELNVRLVRHGEMPSVPLKLMVNNKQRMALDAEFNGRKKKVFKINLTIRDTGLHYCRFYVNDQSIDYDNNFYFSFDVPSNIKVLILNSKGKKNKYLNAFFTGDSLIKATFRDFESINYQSLSEYSSIILDQLPSISSGLRLALKDYVNAGGSLVFFPAMNGNKQSYNQFLSEFDDIRFTGKSEKKKRVSSLAWESDFYKGIFENRPQNPDYPVIFKNLNIDYGVASSAEILMAQSDGKPFLLKTPAGKGSVYLFSSACNKESSNFVTHSFFAVLYKMIFDGISAKSLYYTIGESQVYKNDQVSIGQDDIPRLVKKDTEDEVIPALVSQEQGLSFIAGQYVESNGFWHLNYDQKKIDALAYNFDMKESDTQLSDLSNKEAPNARIIEQSPDTLTSAIKMQREGKQLWVWFIIAALVFILFEVVLLRLWKL